MEESRFSVENRGKDESIEDLRSFIEECECDGPAKLLPFFEKREYHFIKGEDTWLQMAYDRIKNNQAKCNCKFKCENGQDSRIRMAVSALADVFSLELGSFTANGSCEEKEYTVTFWPDRPD